MAKYLGKEKSNPCLIVLMQHYYNSSQTPPTTSINDVCEKVYMRNLTTTQNTLM